MLERKLDKEVLSIVASLWDRESVVDILEVLKKLVRSERGRIDRAIAVVEEGGSFVEALESQRLISKDLAEYMTAAENSKVMHLFAREKLEVDKKISAITRELFISLISPALAVLISLGVIYIFIYRVIPGFNINEKHLAFLPSYFSLLLTMSKSPVYYVGLLLAVFVSVVLVIAFRKTLPFVSDIYTFYERVKLYSGLYLSVQAGYNLDEALRRYKGALRDQVERALSLIDEGVYISDAFVQSVKMSAVEEVLARIAMSVASKESLKDLYEESFVMLKTKLEGAKQVITLISLLVSAGIILFAYIGILIPLLKAVRSVMT